MLNISKLITKRPILFTYIAIACILITLLIAYSAGKYVGNDVTRLPIFFSVICLLIIIGFIITYLQFDNIKNV